MNGDHTNNSANNSGAVFVFRRGVEGAWTQETYLKASNTDAGDQFGSSLSLSGNLLAVGACWESSAATGVNDDQTDNSANESGAVYIYRY